MPSYPYIDRYHADLQRFLAATRRGNLRSPEVSLRA